MIITPDYSFEKIKSKLYAAGLNETITLKYQVQMYWIFLVLSRAWSAVFTDKVSLRQESTNYAMSSSPFDICEKLEESSMIT